MWRVIIQCSAESWQKHSAEFSAMATRYAGTPIASKKMKGDARRIMEYQIENVSDAEDFVAEAMTLDGFMAMFESL